MRQDIIISPELMQRIRREARREGKRVNQYIMDALRHYTDYPRIGRTMYWYNPKSGRAEPRYIGLLCTDSMMIISRLDGLPHTARSCTPQRRRRSRRTRRKKQKKPKRPPITGARGGQMKKAKSDGLGMRMGS